MLTPTLLLRPAPALALAALLAALPLQAQTAPASQAQVGQVEKRVGVLESQMRAVQRQVFPGADKRLFAPEVVPEAPPVVAPGAPATSPLVDLTQRVVALETQQRSLTGQIEELQFRQRQLEAALQKLEAGTVARLDAMEGAGAPAAQAPAAAAVPAPGTPTRPQPGAARPAAPAPATESPSTAPAPAAAAAGTAATDPLVAQYEAAYALYERKDFAGAEKALRAFAQANPTHPRASNANYWAGRALMQQGMAGEAARVFYAGYQAAPKGQRAHNSLLWLAKALLETRGPKAVKAACDTLDQLARSFPDRMTGAFAADAAATRAQAQCG
jgi:TolA-binding protein